VEQEKLAGNYLIGKIHYKKIISYEQGGPTNPASIKDRLLAWCQQVTKGYKVSHFYRINQFVY